MSSEDRKGYRITRVTTKTGDAGTTGLAGGQRVSKTHPRIAAYGTVDELSAFIATARAEVLGESHLFQDPRDPQALEAQLAYLQNELFTVGGDLATLIQDRHPAMPVTTSEQVDEIECITEAFNACLPPLTDFVLPGGTRTAAALHVCRTVCRRAERAVAALAQEEEIGEHILPFLNRLSDALFVLARWSVHRMGKEETVWKRDMESPSMPGEDSTR